VPASDHQGDVFGPILGGLHLEPYLAEDPFVITYWREEDEHDGRPERYPLVAEFTRTGDAPAQVGQPMMSEDVNQPILNVQLSILGHHLLMGRDVPDSMGFQLNQGKNV
jgi:hypothetical protein